MVIINLECILCSCLSLLKSLNDDDEDEDDDDDEEETAKGAFETSLNKPSSFSASLEPLLISTDEETSDETLSF